MNWSRGSDIQIELHCGSVVCSLSRLSAAIAAAIEGGRPLRLSISLGFSSASGFEDGAAANRDSTSFNVNRG